MKQKREDRIAHCITRYPRTQRSDTSKASKNMTSSWKCSRCGYEMNEAECLTEKGAQPDNGSITMCLNCGAIYEMRNEKWESLKAHEFAKLSNEMKRFLERAERARRKTVNVDLRFWQMLEEKEGK
jgi:transcription elongation factor Elf1